MAGQIGTISVAAQLATSNQPQFSTKDRSYWGHSFSTANASAPPDWDRYQMWGIMGGYANAAASSMLADRIYVIPHFFNRSGRIKVINSLVSTAVGNPAKVTIGLYGPNLDGEVWPGLRVYQSSEATINTGGSSAVISVAPDYLVTPGTMIFLAIAIGQNALIPSLGVNCASMPGMMGTAAVGGAFTSATDWDLISGFRIGATYGTTPNFLPATFPTTGTIGLFGPQQAAGLTIMPAFGMRFLRT